MGSGRLSPLQLRVLEILADVEPGWALAGGAALAGFHLRHRTTRDLDLFWRGRDRLDPRVRGDVERRLRDAGIQYETIDITPSHLRLSLDAEGGGEKVALDLIAEPSPALEPASEIELGAARVRVDGRHEILVDKLCALLGRSELRDLLDVRDLLGSGSDLDRALADAPTRDSGFSAVTLAWVLRGMPLADLALAEGLSDQEATAVASYRDELVAQLTAASNPDS